LLGILLGFGGGVLHCFVNRWVKELEKWAVRPSEASIRFVRVVDSEILWHNVSQFEKPNTF
jgi:hypothetical protein